MKSVCDDRCLLGHYLQSRAVCRVRPTDHDPSRFVSYLHRLLKLGPEEACVGGVALLRELCGQVRAAAALSVEGEALNSQSVVRKTLGHSMEAYTARLARRNTL